MSQTPTAFDNEPDTVSVLWEAFLLAPEIVRMASHRAAFACALKMRPTLGARFEELAADVLVAIAQGLLHPARFACCARACSGAVRGELNDPARRLPWEICRRPDAVLIRAPRELGCAEPRLVVELSLSRNRARCEIDIWTNGSVLKCTTGEFWWWYERWVSPGSVLGFHTDLAGVPFERMVLGRQYPHAEWRGAWHVERFLPGLTETQLGDRGVCLRVQHSTWRANGMRPPCEAFYLTAAGTIVLPGRREAQGARWVPRLLIMGPDGYIDSEDPARPQDRVASGDSESDWDEDFGQVLD
jgi:hypothetical protein